jgi:hypothetical protein
MLVASTVLILSIANFVLEVIIQTNTSATHAPSNVPFAGLQANVIPA